MTKYNLTMDRVAKLNIYFGFALLVFLLGSGGAFAQKDETTGFWHKERANIFCQNNDFFVKIWNNILDSAPLVMNQVRFSCVSCSDCTERFGKVRSRSFAGGTKLDDGVLCL